MSIPASPFHFPIHPGGVLDDAICNRGTSVDELAAATGIPADDVVAVLEERAPITGRMALLLGAYFGTSPHFWMNMQSDYDLNAAYAEIGDALDRVRALPEVVPEGEPAPGRAVGE